MTWKNRFYPIGEDVNGIVGDEKIPYYCVVLSKEEAEQVKDKKMVFYSVDGRQLFDIKNADAKEFTGELAFYVMFVDK